MRVLVTGGAGFIGSHLVERLLRSDAEVVVLDVFTTGKRVHLPVAHDRLRVVNGDVADEAAVRSAMAGCDTVVHLAAVASVEASVQDPVGTHRTNLLGSIRVFEEAAREPGRRVLYASSAAVYGDTQDLPITEDAPPRPLSPYATDKLAGEHYLAHYHRSGRVRGTAFRFFNVFGPRQDPSSPYSGVISIFLDRAVRGQAVKVFGDGGQTRDFVFVSDVVAALLAALDGAGGAPEMPVYNVGRGKSVTLLELLATIERLQGTSGPLRVSHGPERRGDIRHSLADVTRLRSELGWAPAASLQDGLAAILAEVAA